MLKQIMENGYGFTNNTNISPSTYTPSLHLGAENSIQKIVKIRCSISNNDKTVF